MNISPDNPHQVLMKRIRCDLSKNRNLQDGIEYQFLLSDICCNPPSSSSSVPPPSSSSSVPPSSSSSSEPPVCIFESNYIFDEWDWNEGVDTGLGEGVDTWEGIRNNRVLTTLPGRVDSKRSKVQDGCIFVNGALNDKRAYHAFFDDDWYPTGETDVYQGNALFFIVEIDLFKTGESILWNHIITGGYDNGYNSFSSQASTNRIGTRTNGATWENIIRPGWIANGVQRYMVEMRYDYAGPFTGHHFNLMLNGKLIKTVNSTSALKKILGVGVPAPLDYSANSTLNRRLLSVFALRHPVTNHFGRIPETIFQQSRQYLSCKWGITLQP